MIDAIARAWSRFAPAECTVYGVSVSLRLNRQPLTVDRPGIEIWIRLTGTTSALPASHSPRSLPAPTHHWHHASNQIDLF